MENTTHTSNSLALEIKVYRSVEHPEIAAMYRSKQSEALARYGIPKVHSSDIPWEKNPDSYMVVAYLDGEAIGGMRMDGHSQAFPMPSTIILGYVPVEAKKCAEAVGLWTVKTDVLPKGIIPDFLTKTLMAFGTHWNAIYAFPPKHTINLFTRNGFLPISDYENLPYPTESYSSSLLCLPDTESLMTVKASEREKILEIRAKGADKVVQILSLTAEG